MEERATYKSPDGPFTGLFLVVLGFVMVSLPIWMTEADFLGTRVRRGGGIMKLIEQSIGWTGFSLLMGLIGLWCAAMGICALWKGLNRTPDVTAYPDRLEYHPAVRRDDTTYEEVSHWGVHFASGHPVITLHFYDSYWSLQGKWPRTTMVLEGGKEDLEQLFNYFAQHPIMSQKFVPSGH